MAMTKATILAFANEQLNRSEENIDTAILTVINELNRHELLTKDTEGSITQGDTSFGKPTGYKSYVSLQLTGANTVACPLLPAMGGIKGIEELRADVDGDSGTGPPGWYAPYGDNIEFWPAADKDYTYTFKHYYRQARDVENLDYGDEWENVFNFGAAYYTAAKFGITRYIAIWQPIYVAEKKSMILATPRHVRVAGG